MKIVIPMAGYGTRLRPQTWSKPKPLVSVAGKPVLGHIMNMLESLPVIDEVIFIVGYLGEQVQAYMSQTYPRLKTHFFEQAEMLGQSHAIWLARKRLRGPMLITFVDTLIETDLHGLPTEKADAVAWVKEVPDPRRFGVAEVNQENWVHRLVEKPQDLENNLALVGFYYFSQAERLLSAIEKQMDHNVQLKGEYYLADAINVMLDQGLKMRVQPVDIWQDCGKPETLLETNRYLLDHGRDNSADAAKRKDVVVVPPVYIDPTSTVSQSVIGPHVSIGAGCLVHRSVLQDTIIDTGSRLSNTILQGSLIGQDARVQGREQFLNVGDSSEIGLA